MPSYPMQDRKFPDAEEPESDPSPRTVVWHAFKDVAETVGPALIIALLLTQFVAQRTEVYGQSMEPNLHTHQQLMIEKLSFRVRPPARGEIVVIDVPFSDIPLIKRIVGLPGETIAVHGNKVHIDGQPLVEPYLSGHHQSDFDPVVVPRDHYFVLGDNRDASNDSRFFGPVHTDQIIGRAWISVWPLNNIGPLE